MPEDPRHQVNLLDLLAFLLRWRRFIASAVISVAVAVAILTLILPPRYRSEAIVRQQENTSGTSLGSLIASRLGTLGGLANLAPSLGDAPGGLYLTILQSRWMSENVIDRFDLRTVYKMDDGRIEDVIDQLLGNTRFQIDEETSNIVIQVEDRDPVRARDIAQYYVDQLDFRARQLRTDAAGSEKEFIDRRLSEERTRLAALEDSLYRFQMATGVLDIEEQVKATIQATAAMEAQRLAARAEWEMNSQILGPDNPETQFSQFKLASLESNLATVMHSDNNLRRDFLLSMNEAPREGMTYLRIYRDIEIQQLLVGYLLQQFEQAKIEELRNTPTLIRIDPPQVPTKRSWPRRSFMVAIAAFVAFVLAAATALLVDFFERAWADPTHPQYHRLLAIRRSWRKTSAVE